MSQRQVQIAIIGGCRVGKTTLATQLISAMFEYEYTPTADDTLVAVLDHDQTSIKLIIHDTSGSNKFAQAREEKYTQAEGFLAVYDVGRFPSLEELKNIVAKLQEVRGSKKIPMVVVGNKIDLENSQEIETDQGKELARTLDCPYVELTAKERDSVVKVFIQLVREIDRVASSQKSSVQKISPCPRCVVL